MAKLTLKHSETGTVKIAPLGFSWTTLFFGPIPALLRGDLGRFFIQAVVDVLFITPLLIYPFFYNRLYLKGLLRTGYKVVAVEGMTADKLRSRYRVELVARPKL